MTKMVSSHDFQYAYCYVKVKEISFGETKPLDMCPNYLSYKSAKLKIVK